MKLYTKIFLCTIAVLTAALSFMGYRMISGSFNNAMEREIQRGVEEYQLLKYTLQAGILSASGDAERLLPLAVQTAEFAPEGNVTAIFDAQKQLVYSTFPGAYTFSLLEELKEDALEYVIEETHGQYRITLGGRFSQSGTTAYLFTGRDITPVIAERREMQSQFLLTFLAVICVAALVTLLFSLLLTRPLKALARVTRQFKKGRYEERARIKSGDEIGQLARSFNAMANTIEQTIGELALSAQQKDDFVANFAHELKTPLTSVIGYADMIYQRRDLSRQEIKNAAGYIMNEGMRLEALSLKLMDLIVLDRQAFTMEETYMPAFFKDVEDTLRPLIHNHRATLSIAAEPAYALMECDLMKTLVLNLVDNAVKADSAKVALTGLAVEKGYRISVSDDGRGIPKEQLMRITEAFYMVDKSRSRKQHGAGLGLAIVARIAQLHGASLVFTSREGQGTVVEITLCPPGGTKGKKEAQV